MRVVARIFFWLLALVGALCVVIIGVGVTVAQHHPAPPLPKHMILTLNLDQGVVEGTETSPFAAFGVHHGYQMADIVKALDHAARDPRINAVVAHIDAPQLGMGRAQELRDAILAFRKSGKRSIVYSTSLGGENGGTLAYYVASAFQEIWLQPSGDVNLTGFMLQSPFFKGTFDMLGVRAEFGARHEYKSAIEPYTHDHFSKEAKESLQLLLDSWNGQVVDGVASARQLSPAAVSAAIDSAPLLADEALQDKLIDRIAYQDELDKALAIHGAENVDLNTYVAAITPEPTAVKVALIYGVGEIRGTAANGFSQSAIMAADHVAEAFRAAAKDPSIKAILFRIDSPGGSYVASDTIWREVSNARAAGKPVVVSMSDLAASGGYFSAIPADRIVAQPGTITGSIGAFSGKFVLADFWKKIGVSWDDVHSGQNSGMYSEINDFSTSQWQRLNAELDHVYSDFTSKTVAARHLNPGDIDRLARGRIWSGAMARDNGLIDALGGYPEAFNQIRMICKLPSQMPVELILFPHPKTPIEALAEMMKTGQLPDNFASAMTALQRINHIVGPLADSLPDQTESELRMPPVQAQ